MSDFDWVRNKATDSQLKEYVDGHSRLKDRVQLLSVDLEAAKLREAELASALEIARTALGEIASHSTAFDVDEIPYIANEALTDTSSPSAALAERDRAIEKRTAERCAEIVRTVHMPIKSSDWAGILNAVALKISEFNLEPKPEGE